mmetsp:Transcript_21764/g.60819  ORF Transcript_21764/g.60819 Transcript_21764/m.60819 type:complete len:207 (+) Transcript_21764:644-1264(+)
MPRELPLSRVRAAAHVRDVGIFLEAQRSATRARTSGIRPPRSKGPRRPKLARRRPHICADPAAGAADHGGLCLLLCRRRAVPLALCRCNRGHNAHHDGSARSPSFLSRDPRSSERLPPRRLNRPDPAARPHRRPRHARGPRSSSSKPRRCLQRQPRQAALRCRPHRGWSGHAEASSRYIARGRTRSCAGFRRARRSTGIDNGRLRA